MSEGEPSLKCVIAWSDRRHLCSLVAEALKQRVRPEELSRLGDDSLLVYHVALPADIRDWVAHVLEPDESVLVLEFEKWSGRGPGVEAEWLMGRGH